MFVVVIIIIIKIIIIIVIISIKSCGSPGPRFLWFGANVQTALGSLYNKTRVNIRYTISKLYIIYYVFILYEFIYIFSEGG